MRPHFLLRLSRSGLSNGQLLLNNDTLPPGRFRFSPDVWHSLSSQDQQHSASPHPETPLLAPPAVMASPDSNWRHKFAKLRDYACSVQPQGRFRAQAPSPPLGVAEMAAALALASFGSIHPPAVADHQYVPLPMSIESPLRTVLDDSFLDKLSAHSSGQPTEGVTASPTSPQHTNSGHAPSSDATADALEMPPTMSSTGTSVGAPSLGAAVVRSETTLEDSYSANASYAALAGTAADYLPASLLALVPSSFAAYWQGVSEATRSSLLHATIYLSPKAWVHAAPTIMAMIGTDGNGPAGRVRFALVPLGADYATRADAAQAKLAQTASSSSGSSSSSAAASASTATAVRSMDDVAAQFGLDVALAACVAGLGRGGLRRLDMCPAMVVRDGYRGSTRSSSSSGGEVCPSWRMRQELDAHLRRNLMYAQEQQMQRFRPEAPQQDDEQPLWLLV